VREPKADASKFWAAFTADSKSLAPKVGKVYLVGMLKPTLDVSAAQVGAPTAWAAGHTGAGTTVGLVDTGIDQNHPDLKGVVADAVDFTHSESGPKDEIGHGTHVAGTIAGRGSASDDKYTGIAKGARIMSAKVCMWQGCPEDAILAGMEWAATGGAKVINMSLGGPPSETGDFLEEAVNYYTRVTGALFVIAAGNDGAPESIGSPGTADSALTVGSVDKKTDELSFFSSQGPRVVPSRRFDYAIKPDITAPGHEIIAARAEGTLEDAKVGEHYAQISGTSMATPHVAGGAAILAAQHPDWTPAQLKSALMSTAKFNANQTVYQQGAGRMDVGRAATQALTATGALNLGYFPWPNANAKPSAQAVTYTNRGTTPVQLKLGLKVSDDKGKPAAPGMFRVSAKTVTVPAGKTASVNVTITPKAGKFGLYSGVLTAATADGKTAVQTAIGAYKEAESYNLSVLQLNRKGGKGPTNMLLVNRKTGQFFYDFNEGALLKRVPAGQYTVLTGSYVLPDDPNGAVSATMSARNITLNKPSEFVFDAREGKPVNLKVDRPDTVIQDGIGVDMLQRVADGGVGGGDYAVAGSMFTVPSGANIPGFEFGVTSTLVKKGTGRPGLPATPFTYNIALPGKGKFPAVPNFTARAAEMATVVQKINRQHADEQRELLHFGFTPASTGGSAFPTPLGDLKERTDYFTTKPGTKFQPLLVSGSLTPEGWNNGEYWTFGVERGYKPGEKTSETWNEGVFGPAFVPEAGYNAIRVGDSMRAFLPLLSSSRQFGGPGMTDVGLTTLSRDGKTIWHGDYPGYLDATVPADQGTYLLEMKLGREPAWAHLSKQVEIAWTFKSKNSGGEEPTDLPLQAVRFFPKLNSDNQAPASGAFSVPVRIERVTGSEPATVKTFTVEVSYDNGTTWVPATVTGTGNERVVNLTHPASGSVSLRAKAADSAGNTVEQTITNAYTLK
jgi:hypothetical protein